MTPKSLLRHPMAISRAEDFTDGSTFHRVLWDDAQKGNSTAKLKADDKIKRVVMCSGKVYYDLLAERDAQGLDDVYLLRVEQLYPVPTISLDQELVALPEGRLRLVPGRAEEPGRLVLHRARDRDHPDQDRAPSPPACPMPAARPRASPATGLASRHKHEQQTLVAQALGLTDASKTGD